MVRFFIVGLLLSERPEQRRRRLQPFLLFSVACLGRNVNRKVKKCAEKRIGAFGGYGTSGVFEKRETGGRRTGG